METEGLWPVGWRDKWYTVREAAGHLQDNGGVLAEKSVWMRYLSSDNLRSFFYEERNEAFACGSAGAASAASMTSASTDQSTCAGLIPGGIHGSAG